MITNSFKIQKSKEKKNTKQKQSKHGPLHKLELSGAM